MVQAMGERHKYKRYRDFYEYYNWWASQAWDAIKITPSKEIHLAGWAVYRTRDTTTYDYKYKYVIDGKESQEWVGNIVSSSVEGYHHDIILPDPVVVPAGSSVDIMFKGETSNPFHRCENGYDP